MPGFSLSIGTLQFAAKEKKDNIQRNSISGPNFFIQQFTIKKFLNDKIFYEGDSFISVLDGVILNKSELQKEGEKWAETVERLYRTDGDNFFKSFRGSFIGLFYDKVQNKWLIFNDHIGSKPLFYSSIDQQLIVSSEITDLYSLYKENNIDRKLDKSAAYMLLSYGYMVEGRTLCEGIRKLGPGSVLTLTTNNFSTEKYYKLPLAPTTDRRSTNELIEGIDKKFRSAIKRQFEKDLEYGYKNLVALSGGLDSRMTCWVAHKMGYKKQLNFTFSQSNYLDETIPKKIAADLRHEWMFKFLDNGIFLEDVEEITQMTGGNVLYYTLAHGNSLIKYLNVEDLGIVHTGQLGDVIIGSWLKTTDTIKSKDKAFSKKLLYKAKKEVSDHDIQSMEEKENLLFYRRGFNGTNAGLMAFQEKTETISPFYDLEFLEFCLSIPIVKRENHKLYKKWVIQKYPGAAEYVWETTRKPLNFKERKEFTIPIKGKQVKVSTLKKVILGKMGLVKNTGSRKTNKNQMNPLDFWYETNPDIKEFQDQYFSKSIDFLKEHGELQKEVKDLYQNGTAIEKNQVLTLLSSLKMFFQ